MFWKFGFELFVFTVDLDLISIQLRHAVNAKREATVVAHLRNQHKAAIHDRRVALITIQMDPHYNPMRSTSNDTNSHREAGEESLGKDIIE